MEGLSKITFLFADGKIEPSLELSSPSSQGACLVLEGFGASGGVRRNLPQPQRWGSPWQAGEYKRRWGKTESYSSRAGRGAPEEACFAHPLSCSLLPDAPSWKWCELWPTGRRAEHVVQQEASSGNPDVGAGTWVLCPSCP